MKKINFLFLIFIFTSCGIQKLNAQYADTLPCDSSVFIANAWTPNDDGIVQPFRPQFINPPVHYVFKIYDRWGNLIFISKDNSQGWKGMNAKGDHPAEMGTYVWLLEYSYANEKVLRSCVGHVSLIR